MDTLLILALFSQTLQPSQNVDHQDLVGIEVIKKEKVLIKKGSTMLITRIELVPPAYKAGALPIELN